MDEKTQELLETAIQNVLGRIRSNVNGVEAMQYSQGLLSLAHAVPILKGEQEPQKRGPGRPRKDEAKTD